MFILGLLLTAVLIGGGIVFVGHVIQKAREAGAFASTPKKGSRKTKVKAAARNAPHSVRTIVTQAWADNWVAKRAHVREQNATQPPEVRQKHRLMRRLVGPPTVSGGSGGASGPAPALVPVAGAATNGQRPAAVPADPGHAKPSAPAHPHLRPVPSPAQGRTQQMPNTNGSGPSSDMFTAANALTQQAMAGGIRDKSRAIKVFGEAFEGLATVLREMATRMAEPGSEYPAMVYEPILTASTHIQAAGMAMGESDNGMTSLMNMPVGELAASPVHAPHNTELNAG